MESDEIPVDSDVTPVESELTPVDTLVDSVSSAVLAALTAALVAYSCEPLTASVLVPSTWPAATLVICRSLPVEPTLTTPAGAPPA
ncbi:hypothetical protein LMG29542_08434 [Paraburkholderia humisilvae]|uniref:Uncharacterized protein n=1 Tax=Paraburkholderia humisilvae TaxID=627669 RepID=A0A6J5FBF0_9BURK|nr:hypothetical protein LMG29542_08434 [Paraburkholderia humisilvae]